MMWIGFRDSKIFDPLLILYVWKINDTIIQLQVFMKPSYREYTASVENTSKLYIYIYIYIYIYKEQTDSLYIRNKRKTKLVDKLRIWVAHRASSSLKLGD